MIKVADMVKQMQKLDGQNRYRPVSLIYCTADRKRKTGGEIRVLLKARLLSSKRNAHRIALFRPLGTADKVAVHLDLILFFNQQEVV